MAATRIFLSLLLGIFALVEASSVVIPGPGLPSLESLGLTSEQLYNMPLIRPTIPIQSINGTTDSNAATGFDSVCLDQTHYGAPMADIQACFLYLNSMTTTNCVVAGPNLYKQVFCTAGNDSVPNGPFAMIVGQNIGTAPGGTSSRCDYIAFAVLWALDNCMKNVPALNNDLMSSGSCAAYGNGALRVDTVLMGSESVGSG